MLGLSGSLFSDFGHGQVS